MPVQLYHLIAFLVSVTFVLWTIPDVKTLGLKLGIVDQPNARKIHKDPVVRVGGVSIFAGTITALSIIWLLGGFAAFEPSKVNELWVVIIGSILFFGIGFADDLFNLTPISRLLMQVVVAAGCWYLGVRIEFLSLPFYSYSLVKIYWLSLPVTVFWLVGMANAINWIDGVDGLAAGVSGIAAFVMLVVTLFK
jgi:UDP-GlcNAc:undecaprenyl-phosphate GlcNAc-1-phosphate transferase